jgi:hypothetical protein
MMFIDSKMQMMKSMWGSNYLEYISRIKNTSMAIIRK